MTGDQIPSGALSDELKERGVAFLKHAMELTGWNMAKLADEADVAYSTINRPIRELSNTLSFTTIYKVASAVDKSLAERLIIDPSEKNMKAAVQFQTAYTKLLVDGLRISKMVEDAREPNRFNEQLMQATIEAVEAVIQREGRKVSPAKKAELIVAVYDAFKDLGDVDEEKIERLVRLAT